jgi:hypothetical protein
LGRWYLDPGAEDAHLNGTAVAPGDHLVPGASGEWRLIAGQTDTRGRFLGDCLPDTQDIDAFLGFGDLLAGPWLEWCDRSPLAPGLGEAIKPHPLESAIERELGHLAVVCLRPQTHIRLEPERLAVARARRLDRKVFVRLAAHTEDWAQRKLTGVQPSHVLAQVREEQWNLYENRVAVRLVDGLAAWLRRRLGEVRRILNGVFARLEEQGAVSSVNWRRRDRLYRIWGEATEATAARTLAERTCKRLEGFLYRVLGLMDSPLYRAIPNRAQVPRGLRMTNLFANHDQYRGVARLWDQWSRHAASGSLSPAQLYQRHQGLVGGFDAWCLLLVVRGLQQLGYEPLDAGLERPLEPGCAIALQRGYRLTWDWDGIRLWDGNSARIRLLPLAHALDRLKPPQLRELVDDIAKAVADQGPWTVILHPAVPEPAAGNGLAGVLDPPLPEVRGALDWLRVSPFTLDSVERVSRLLRWALLAPRFLAYPPRLGPVPAEFKGGLSRHIGLPANGGYALLEPMADHETAKLGVDAAVLKADQERRRLAAERDELDRRLRELRGDRRGMADLNLEKRNLLDPLRRVEANAKRLQVFQASLGSGRQALADLSICPVCGGQGRLISRGGDCFEAACQDPSCVARWGLHLGESGQRVPFLEIGWQRGHPLPPSYQPIEVDEALGCDVLAVPSAGGASDAEWRAPRSVPR